MVEKKEGLGSKQLSKIRSTVLKAREMIEKDLERQLEKYGIYEEQWMDLNELSYLSSKELEKRKHIDAALEREMNATGDQKRSYKNYVKESSYHHLNRLFGLKLLEEREFITQTLTKDPEYGNMSYLHRTIYEIAGELCESEDEGFKYVLDSAYDEVGEEIGLLFEENDYTVIDLDFKVRKDVIELLNGLDEEIWQADDIVGWMYQYFGENEREEIDERIDDENYKVQDTDIGVKTQLFTPRYIVEWMVDNSLGRLWLEMYPESNINDEDKCFYLAPLEESLIDREVKDVRDIKVLDPACGSGHMLFYAFDVLYEMYKEQGDVLEQYIPREILKNNLYGIDIDPYAVQLAALALFVKAKSKERDVKIEQMNLVPADAVLVNGDKKKEIMRKANELEKKVLEEVWESFQNVREFGSLIRIEKKIEKVIEEEREKLGKTGQSKFDFDKGTMISQAKFMDKKGVEKSWEEVKDSILEKVKRLAEDALEHNNPVEEMFAGEVEKSVKLLDLFVSDYDVVVTNPPYLGSKKMGKNLKKFVKDNYIGSRDLYTAFIERCGEFVKNEGYFSMITMETFMYLYSYRKLRPHLLENYNFIDATHIRNRDAGYMNICFSARKIEKSKFKKSRFNRLVNHKDKIKGLQEMTNFNKKKEVNDDVYIVDQNSFSKIRRTPFLYWFGQEILKLFIDNQPIKDVADVKVGLQTGDDDKFLRKWWEIKAKKINKKYYWFMPSGESKIYYYSTEKLVKWENNGHEIKNYKGSVVRNEEYYFKRGIGVRYFGNYITARFHSENFIFSNHSNFIHTGKINNDKIILGYINSSLIQYIMEGLSPGLVFQVGEIKAIPTKNFSKYNERIVKFVKNGIKLQKDLCTYLEIKKEFKSFEQVKKLLDFNFIKNIKESDISIIHGLIDYIVFEEYEISENVQKRIYKNLPKNLSDYPHITNAGELDTDEYEFRKEVSTKELPDDEYDDLVNKIEELADKDLREISEELEISPYTVAMVKQKHDLYTNDEMEEAAGRLLSYYLGCIMGRWELDSLEPDSDGIVVFENAFDDNVIDLIRECIELTYGEDEVYEKEKEIEDMLNKDIEDWMRNNFFRYHHCKEYRRRGQRIPIYWHLESEEGTFSSFVYYHKMNKDTFPKIRGQYLDVMIDRRKNRLQSVEKLLDDDGTSESRKKKLRSEEEELIKELDDLKKFRENLDKLIAEDFEPDFEAGIWKNIQVVDEYDLLSVPLDKL